LQRIATLLWQAYFPHAFMSSEPSAPSMPANARLFVWFRLLFNCRFYYPVYTVLFLDFGLNLEQFAILNVVWAVTIVLLEVPSGALADVVGRRNMVVLAAVLMVVEMIVFAMLPVGGPWVFWVFMVNRVISGAAEAMASGADEALAYDSISKEQQTETWPRVMARLSRWMALGFIVSSLIGAFVYDASSVNRALYSMGWENAALAKETTLKFPIYLCVLTALVCLGVTLAMREPQGGGAAHPSFRENVRASWRGIREAGLWIWRTPVPLLLLTLGFLLDSIVRLFYTVASNFYRLIGLTEASFGVISVASSLAAFFTTHWMEWLVRHRSSKFNFALVIAMVSWGLIVVAHPLPGWWGILAIAPLLLSMRFFQFFLSHYLNEATSSERRATVLSFRGMSMNLAYGAVTLLFGWQTAYLSGRLGVGSEDVRVFAAALTWWPWWFAGTMVAYVIFRAWRLRKAGLPADDKG
jgi:MFS family permease